MASLEEEFFTLLGEYAVLQFRIANVWPGSIITWEIAENEEQTQFTLYIHGGVDQVEWCEFSENTIYEDGIESIEPIIVNMVKMAQQRKRNVST